MPKPRFSEEQKRIAVLLMAEPRTAEEINKQLGIPYDKLGEQLKEMLRLELITKEGYPLKYSLKKEIYEAVKKRKTIEEKDSFRLRLKMAIEAQAIEESILKKQLDELEAALRKEKNITIYDIRRAKIIKSGEYHSSYLEVNLSVRNFKVLVNVMYFYGPVSVEVIKPQKYEVDMSDLQDGLVDMAELIHAYNDYILKLMNRQELNDFYNKLYAPKK